MATVSNPQPPNILPPAPDKEQDWSEDYGHILRDRLMHQEPTTGETLQTIMIALAIVGSVVGAAIWYLMTH